MSEVPELRVRKLNDVKTAENGQFVLYWMTAFRRPFYNFALQRAVERAKELQKPLLILEALRCDYPFASDRLHRFILQGMADNAEHFATTSAVYYPFVETETAAGKGLLEKLAESACLIVADDHPGFFYPHMLKAAARKVSVLLEAVDSNGLLPLRAADRDYPTAYAFRRFLQKELPGHLFDFPLADPLCNIDLPQLGTVAEEIRQRWQPTTAELLLADPTILTQ
ncbi:MAG: deoxyribodipyrimidine photolyase, partial [Deltaproteobacteria bacterium]|nr:deoxyribodipyrimidine photolyase [Deltaproteobacteria bacterium]